jgi:hypothetical protein
MPLFLALSLGLAAGLHAALYGAYKDSPHENFKAPRFARELAIASVAIALLAAAGLTGGQTPFVLYLSAFALSRIVTEFWKLFVRVEPQEHFRIPTQIHWIKGVVHHPALRLLMGAGFLASIYGIGCLTTIFPDSWPAPLRGIVLGLAIGAAEAVAGAYKDGAIEGFYWYKFAKSPSFGVLGGLIASGHTTHPLFLLLATIGSMRMFLELLFKMLPRDYAPGKFSSMVGPFGIWYQRRQYFVAPYALTWGLYLVLCSHTAW